MRPKSGPIDDRQSTMVPPINDLETTFDVDGHVETTALKYSLIVLLNSFCFGQVVH